MGALLHGCPCGLLLLCLGQEEHGRCWGLVLLHVGIELSDQESQGGGKGRCAMTAASKGHGLHVSERVSESCKQRFHMHQHFLQLCPVAEDWHGVDKKQWEVSELAPRGLQVC